MQRSVGVEQGDATVDPDHRSPAEPRPEAAGEPTDVGAGGRGVVEDVDEVAASAVDDAQMPGGPGRAARPPHRTLAVVGESGDEDLSGGHAPTLRWPP